MSKDDNPRYLRFHFEGPPTKCHTLPATALIKALEKMQRVVYLLAMFEEGRGERKRLRPSRDIERKFPLICTLPEEGGYAMPAVIGNPGDRLYDEQEIEAVALKTQQTIRAIDQGSNEELIKIVPDSIYRNSIIAAFEQMLPAKRHDVVVSIEDYKKKRIFNGKQARQQIQKLRVRPESGPEATWAYVTGVLIEMKFEEKRLRLKLLGSSRALDASYSDDFEPVLLDHPREMIQVHGNVVYNDEGTPKTISDVDEILEVDDSPMQVRFVEIDGNALEAKEPLDFDVVYNAESQLYELSGEFDIILGAETRPELEGQLNDELVMLWEEYALAEPDSLTTAAQRLRENLLATFEVVTDAP